jgi:threonine synthase
MAFVHCMAERKAAPPMPLEPDPPSRLQGASRETLTEVNPLQYISTRGGAPQLGFADVLLTGLAQDGGLYLPTEWPQLDSRTIAGFAGQPYAATALAVIAPFIGDAIKREALQEMIARAYEAFLHPATVPLVQIGPDQWLAELFHGPTLAFKDLAMQLLARLMDHVLAERAQRATIVGATSGDTGGAAVQAFRGGERTDLFILFPRNRVSPIQQRQMTTSSDERAHAIAVDGTFDDCQALVKALFNDHAFRQRVGLGGVNSINWARIMAQIVYYFTTATALGAPGKTVNFTVPTGNFGDIFAGYAAKRMGLPVGRLVIATNRNDILARTLATGRYEVDEVQATFSPSMDIQVSSNFERLIFESCRRDSQIVSRLMSSLSQSQAFSIPESCLEAMRQDFLAGRANEDETLATIARLYRETGYLADPHTAVALKVAGEHPQESPMITLATAHPAKFPDTVRRASGQSPILPERIGDLMRRKEKFETLPNDVVAVREYIETTRFK